MVDRLSKIAADDYLQRGDVYLQACVEFHTKGKAGCWQMHWHHANPVFDKGPCDEWNMVYVTGPTHELLHTLRALAFRDDGTMKSYYDAKAATALHGHNKIYHDLLDADGDLSTIKQLYDQAHGETLGIEPPMLKETGKATQFKTGGNEIQSQDRERGLSKCVLCAANGLRACVCKATKKRGLVPDNATEKARKAKNALYARNRRKKKKKMKLEEQKQQGEGQGMKKFFKKDCVLE